MDGNNVLGWVILLGIAFACGWRAGNILQDKKGRNWYIGFLLGFVGGLLGIAVAYLVPATAEVKQFNQQKDR